jgi:Bacterial SH3 domain
MDFKSIPFSAVITRKDNSQTVAKQLQSIINAQATEGWTFLRIETIKTLVAPNNGCFGIGATNGYATSFPIAIFYKHDDNNTTSTTAHGPTIEEKDVLNSNFIEASSPIQTTISSNDVQNTDLQEMVEFNDNTLPNLDFVVQKQPVEDPNAVINQKLLVAGQWIKSHKKIIAASLGCLIIIFIGYNFWMKQNAKNDGALMADMYCSCEKEKNNQLIFALQNFDNAFQSFQFPTQIEARAAYQNATTTLQSNFENCKIRAQDFKNKAFNKYVSTNLIDQFNGSYQERYSYCNANRDSDFNRLTGQIESKINQLKPDYSQPVVDSVNYLSSLQSSTGSLIIDASVLNIRDKPSKDEGNIIFKTEKGTILNFTNQYMDERGIVWYNIEMNGQYGWASGLYVNLQGIEATVSTSQVFFYDLDYTTLTFSPKKQYLEYGQKTTVFRKLVDYIYTEYTNTQGITTKGWLKTENLQ